MINLSLNALIALTISFLMIFGFANYYPLFENDNLGATLTTLNSSDNLVDFPTTYNANNTAINNDLTALEATTTMSLLTTAVNLVSIGTITSGTWQSTDVGVAYGGTGASTFTEHAVLLGSSTNPFVTVSGVGTSGQFLTSNGAGSAPTWQTSAVDEAIAYDWTDHHTFTSAFFTIASSTNATTTNDHYVGNDLYIDNNGDITGTLTVDGASTLTGNVTFGAGAGLGLTATSVVQSACGSGSVCSKSISCPSGYEELLSSGFSSNPDSSRTLLDSYRSASTTWTYKFSSVIDTTVYTLYALCLNTE